MIIRATISMTDIPPNMNKIDKEAVKQAFASYTAQYNAEDPKIKLKIDHTYRVADLCEKIAATVPGTNTDLTWLSGMLHDVGRFEQVRRYNTFADAKSVDHAQFGADLLFADGLIDSFGPYDENYKSLLETVIRNHNRFRIDEGLTYEYKTYCQILRDADKIDILRVNVETPIEDIYNVSSDELKRAAVTEEVRQGFREKHAIPRAVRRTPADLLVSHISMVYELVYPISWEIVWEQGYLNDMLKFESENEETQKWFDFMRKELLEGRE